MSSSLEAGTPELESIHSDSLVGDRDQDSDPDPDQNHLVVLIDYYLKQIKEYDLRTNMLFDKVERCGNDPRLIGELSDMLEALDYFRMRISRTNWGSNDKYPKPLVNFVAGSEHVSEDVVNLFNNKYEPGIDQLVSSCHTQLLYRSAFGDINAIKKIMTMLRDKFDINYVDSNDMNALKLAFVFNQSPDFIGFLLDLPNIQKSLVMKDGETNSVSELALKSSLINSNCHSYLTNLDMLVSAYLNNNILLPPNTVSEYFEKKLDIMKFDELCAQVESKLLSPAFHSITGFRDSACLVALESNLLKVNSTAYVQMLNTLVTTYLTHSLGFPKTLIAKYFEKKENIVNADPDLCRELEINLGRLIFNFYRDLTGDEYLTLFEMLICGYKKYKLILPVEFIGHYFFNRGNHLKEHRSVCMNLEKEMSELVLESPLISEDSKKYIETLERFVVGYGKQLSDLPANFVATYFAKKPDIVDKDKNLCCSLESRLMIDGIDDYFDRVEDVIIMSRLYSAKLRSRIASLEESVNRKIISTCDNDHVAIQCLIHNDSSCSSSSSSTLYYCKDGCFGHKI